MTLTALIGFIAFVSCASGQQHNYVDYDYQAQALARPSSSGGIPRAAVGAAVRPTPVPIIKQINRHNDDGSYTYGYEGADGSFKIETKLPTGEVSGKYGYVDDTGKLRVVDYGANRYGFQPAGEGITVAPPTLIDETTDKIKENSFAEYDDEGILYTRPQPQPIPRPVVRQQKRPRPVSVRPVEFAPQPQPQFIAYEAVPRSAAPAPAAIPVQHFQAIPQQPQPQFQHQQHYPQAVLAYEQPRHTASSSRESAIDGPISGPISAPVRAVVPGGISSGPLFRPHALPAPATPAPRPAPVRETHARPSASSRSVLDTLIQQYALPQGVGQPLHDISFGSYSSQTNY